MIQAFLLFLVAAQEPKVPDGFTIEKVADATFPMFGCFDDKGYLYVTESSGGDLYLELQKKVRDCKVRRFSPDFKTSTVFAENLTPSMGLVWRDGKLYVADPPDLVTLEDTDGDGKADKRTVLLSDFGHQDNGSLHGLTFGPDGLLYGTMGQPDGYKLKAREGKELTGKSGILFRCKPDGSDCEVLCRGFENLVEIVFMPNGDILGTCNWYQKPVGGIRDAIIHLVPGGLYPYVPDKGTAYPFTGDVIPPLALFPAVALSGMCRDGNTLFTAQHNSRKVQRHVLTKSGASYTSQDFEFVSSENPDFHPSDVLFTPDGRLLVIDTGAWYVQHCPTGKIRNSRAPGGIYRVTYKAARGLREEVDEARALGWKGDRSSAATLGKMLSSKDPSHQLAAAEALATCGTKDSLPALWEALEATTDKFVEHQVIHAIYRLAGTNDLEEALKNESPKVRKAAIVLLDQRDPNLRSATVIGLAGSTDAPLRQAAIHILQKHSAWAGDAVTLLLGLLNKEPLSEEERGSIRGLIVAFQSEPRVRNVVGAGLVQLGPDRRSFLLECVAQTSLPKFDLLWEKGVELALSHESATLRAQAVRTAAVLQLSAFDDRLAQMAAKKDESTAVRIDALRAIVSRRPTLAAENVEFLVERLSSPEALERLGATEALRRAKLSDADLARTLRAIKSDGLLMPSLFIASLRDAGGPAIEAAADAIRAGWRPTPEELGPLLEKLPPETRSLLEKGAQEQRAKLEKFQPLLSGGSSTLGRAVFFGKKVACSACHAIGNEGGRIGPDLTKVGAIRSGRDILESILVPSSTFAQGYEPYLVATKDGNVLSGLMARQDAEGVVLKDASGAETRVRHDRIREIRRGTTSIMPEGLERNLTEDEFRNLLAFLQSLK